MDLVGILVEALPLVALALLSQWGRERPGRRKTVLILLGITSCIIAAAGLLVLTAGLLTRYAGDPVNYQDLRFGGWLTASGILSLLVLFKGVRKGVSVIVPGELQSTAQVAGLWLYTATLLFLIGVSTSVNILGNLSSLPEDQLTQSINPVEVLISGLVFPLAALLGAGFPLKRGLSQVGQRLGLGPLKLKHLKWVIGFTVVSIGLDSLFGLIMDFLPGETEQQIDRVLSQMAGGGDTGWLGLFLLALAIGISAGVGEELLFRGLLQPVFGNLAVAFLFASLHLQYGFTLILLQLVVWSLMLGYIKNKTNTTVAITAHALYDFIAVMLTGFS